MDPVHVEGNGRGVGSPVAPDVETSIEATWTETLDRLAEICTKPPVVIARPTSATWVTVPPADDCVDVVTGLRTTAVLRLRLEHVFEQCVALGLEPNWLHRLVIVDADTADLTGGQADATMAMLADLVKRRFVTGETICRGDGRIYVLANDTHPLDHHVAAILAEARGRSLLQAARIFCWVEDLPADSSQIDRYLADLSA